MWSLYDNGASIDTTGSENGTIIKDGEHPQGARITLEKDGHTPYGITCGIYGSMCHTAFASAYDEVVEKYGAMKLEIDRVLSTLLTGIFGLRNSRIDFKYCQEKGVKPVDLTLREWLRFKTTQE